MQLELKTKPVFKLHSGSSVRGKSTQKREMERESNVFTVCMVSSLMHTHPFFLEMANM